MSPATALQAQTESYRRELIAYCYRFFGSYPEAGDAVQETMLHAWQRAADFEGRSSLRTWLYSIATNTCLDMQRAPQRRSLPMDLTSPGRVPDNPARLATRSEDVWVGPIADSHLGAPDNPADITARRDSVRLAFITALQVLPPRLRGTAEIERWWRGPGQVCRNARTVLTGTNGPLSDTFRPREELRRGPISSAAGSRLYG